MAPKKEYKLGAHMSIAGGLHNALLEGSKLGCDTIQLFVANQRQWKHPPLCAEEIGKFKRIRRDTNINPVVAHSSYLVNPASYDSSIYEKSVATMSEELKRCVRLGIEYYVFHPGSHKGKGEREGLHRVAGALKTILKELGSVQTRLLLETTAGQGTNLGYTFEQLAFIMDSVKKPECLGICMDTCHVFAAGYNLGTEKGYRETFGEFERTIGLDNLYVVHINDSKFEAGSLRDRHEHIGKGKLGKEGLARLVTDKRLKGLPFILETPKGKSPEGVNMDAVNLAALRRYIS